jgi:serine/threonine protein kinase
MIRAGSELIPGYFLEERLGKGQFGEVWRARSPGNTYVALKILPLSGQHGWKEFRAVQRVKQIRHANLMPIIAIWLLDEDGAVISDDVIETIARSANETTVAVGSRATLIAEPVAEAPHPAQMVIQNLLANQTLGDRLRDCQEHGLAGIPVNELLGYMDEAAKGLDYLNSTQQTVGDSHGAVQHCDVKPDNIMLTGGSAVVSDFGVAQLLAEADKGATATSLGGTPAYMAPECFQSKTSHATDQYALAITYYQLRTGLLPFENETYATVYETHKTGTHDFSAVPLREQTVLRRATSPDPGRRYDTCVDLAQQLRLAVAPNQPPQSPKKLMPLALAAIVAALVLAWALAGLLGGSALAPITNSLNRKQFAAAMSQVEDLNDADLVTDALAAIQDALGNEHELPGEVLGAKIKLIDYLRNSELLTKPSQGRFEALSQSAHDELDQRLGAVRSGCEQWNPEGEKNLVPKELKDKVDELRKLLGSRSVASLENVEVVASSSLCAARRPAFELQEIRIEARKGLENWASLPQRLAALRAEDLPDGDRPYLAALSFALSGGGVKLATKDEISQRLSNYLQFSAEFRDDQPAAWEQRQIALQMTKIDDSIDPEWLVEDESFASLVGSCTTLEKSKDAKDRLRQSIAIAHKRRQAGQFAKARDLLKGALQLVENMPTVTSGAADQSIAQLIQDELWILDLVDPATPATVIYDRLAGSPQGDFSTWARIAAQIHLEYDTTSEGKIAASKIDIDRAALVEALRWECLWSDPAAPRPVEIDVRPWQQALASTPYADYGRYVASLQSWGNAKQEKDPDRRAQLFLESSQEIQTAFGERRAGSLLTASFRRNMAHTVLRDSIADWSDGQPPTDADFGDSGIFGENAAQAFSNLRLARTLGAPSLSRDAMLLAAAMASWDAPQNEHASELLAVSQLLVERGQSDKTVQGLLGTIHGAAFRAGLATGAADLEQVRHVAEALNQLYLGRRPGTAGDGATLTSAQLRKQFLKIKNELIAPALPIADRVAAQLANSSPSGDAAEAVGAVYRAAGLLLREKELAFDADKAQSVDEAYDYLQRANTLAPHPVSLIEQGRLLSDLSNRPDDWRDRINDIADGVVALTLKSGSPEILCRALALQSYARLMWSRYDRRPLTQRKQDLAEARQIIETAMAHSQEIADRSPSDFANCLLTRATINVEYAFYGSLAFDDRTNHLVAACEDAQQASEIVDRSSPEIAYNAWGNALEDLAFYCLEDPPHNYRLACEQFQRALSLTQPPLSSPNLRLANVAEHRNLLRCQVRRAENGVLASEKDERLLLNDSIDSVTSSLPFLEEEEPDAIDVDAKKMGDLAELYFWLCRAERALAIRTMDSAEKAKAQRRADVALIRALRWARQSGNWDDWGQYQCFDAKTKCDAGDWEAAELGARKVLAAEKEDGVRLPLTLLVSAAEALRACLAEAKKPPWTEREWDEFQARFPSTEGISAPYLVKLRTQRVSALNAWNDDAVVREIDDALDQLAATGANNVDAVRLQLDWLTAKAVWIANRSKAHPDELSRDEMLQRYEKIAADTSSALAKSDALLPKPLRELLTGLKNDAWRWDNPPKELRPWEKRRLIEHLRNTFEARKQYTIEIVALFSKRNDENLRKTARESLRVLHPGIAIEFLANKEEANKWKSAYDGFLKYIMTK